MTDYLVRASALEGILKTLEQLGGNASKLLERTGLTTHFVHHNQALTTGDCAIERVAKE